MTASNGHSGSGRPSRGGSSSPAGRSAGGGSRPPGGGHTGDGRSPNSGRHGGAHPARASLLLANVRMALDALLATKTRSLLTLLGLMIGVGTVIAMLTIISGLDRSMREQVASLGSGVLYVTKHEAGIQFGEGGSRRPRKDLTVDDALAIRDQAPAVAGVSPEMQDRAFLSAGSVQTNSVVVYGVTAAFADVNDWYPEVGRFLTENDLQHRRRVVVLGRAPAEALFPQGSPVGRWIDIEGLPYQVVGVMTGKGKFLGNDQDNVALVPLPVLARLRQYGDAVDYIVVRPTSPAETAEATDEVTEVLRRRRGVRADAPNDFGITTQEALMDLYRQLTGAFYLVTVVLSSIGLTVGGIGVMNMMLVTVKERTREIGVRAALGARRRDILGQFLTEAVTLTLVGGLLGVLLGWSLAAAIRLAFKVPLAVTFGGIAVAVGISGFIGIFFGWYPAFRASRLDPVEALRYE